MLELTGKNFESEVIQNQLLPVLVLWAVAMDVNSTQLAFKIMKLDTTKVKIAKVDIDQSPDLVMRYSVRQVPLLVLFVQGMAVAQDTNLSFSILQNIQ